MNDSLTHKIGVIVWTEDPEGNRRYLLRHNKPFDGYKDEWTIVFGDVEKNESHEEASLREAEEEFNITETESITDLDYRIEYDGKKGKTQISFYAIKVKDIDIPIKLNEESIGYDWMLIDQVKKVMQHDDEFEAFQVLESTSRAKYELT